MPSILRLVPVTALLGIAAWMPTVEATDVPRLSLAIAHPLVRPGEFQTVTVSTAPHRVLTLTAVMPNGDTVTQHGQANARGRLRFRFAQPDNTLGRHSRVASVRVSLDANPTDSAEGRYRIAFAAIDLVVPSQPVPEDSFPTVWVHTRPRTSVDARATPSNEPEQEVSGKTGSQGWYAGIFHIRNFDLYPTTVTIEAHALVNGRRVATTAFVTVQAFQLKAYLGNLVVLHSQNGAWVPTTQVQIGEAFRVAGDGVILEPAGDYFTFVPGIVTIRKGETTLASGALQPGPDFSHGEYAQFRLTDPTDVGQLEAAVELTEYNHPTYRLPFTLVAAAQ